MLSERRKQYMREWSQRPDVKAKLKEKRQDPKRKARDAERHRTRRADPVKGQREKDRCRKRHSGFTPEMLAWCIEQQRNLCAICSVPMELGRGANGLTADHCLETLRPRGLLCQTCNKGLGLYERHQRARGVVIEVYERYRERQVTLDRSSTKGA